MGVELGWSNPYTLAITDYWLVEDIRASRLS